VAGIEVKIDLAGFGVYQAAVTAAVAQAVEAAAEAIVTDAQAVVAVDTGALRDSITATEQSPLVWEVSAGNETVDYAQYVEYGTVKMAARFAERIAEAIAEVRR
jgi:hypothetical protein